jgi:RNA polymerase sigma factor (sigma-70 family)
LKIKDLKDEELIALHISEGGNKWIEELFDRHIRFVVAVCMKYVKDKELAKDIAMQVFEKAITDLPRFDIHNFKSWIYKVSCNASLMHIRSEKKRAEVSIDDEKSAYAIMESGISQHHTNDEGLNGELRLQQLEAALLNLDAEQKQCIELFYLNDKSYKDVASITGFSLNEVKSHIQNGKRNLKNNMSNFRNSDLLLFVVVLIGNM